MWNLPIGTGAHGRKCEMIEIDRSQYTSSVGLLSGLVSVFGNWPRRWPMHWSRALTRVMA